LRETYLLFLISDRDQAGSGIGSELVRRAVTDARAAGSHVLRVDCWAGAPGLVAWYERQGFVRSGRFTVDVRGGWDGQAFELTLRRDGRDSAFTNERARRRSRDTGS
jgi:predicted N-acetyltransferase YhbS